MSFLYFCFFLLIPSFVFSNVPQAAQKTPSFVKALNARIGIVGAGPSGLHMAYLLRKLGYTNVVLFESSNSVGGRSYTVQDDKDPNRVVHELGTCYLSSDYTDLRQMAQQIGYNLEEVLLPEAYLRKDVNSEPVPLRQFVRDRVKSIEPTLNPSSTDIEVFNCISAAETRYRQLRATIFSLGLGQPSYQEFPLTQPPPELLAQINYDLHHFLAINQLMALEPFFLLGMASMGYGSTKDTSALYGLMWMNPAYLADLTGFRENSNLTMLRKGYRSLWEAVGKSLAGFEIKLNTRIKRVARSKSNVRLELENGIVETLDWLVWTPNMLRTAGLFSDLKKDEKAIFSKLSVRKFRTRLIRNAESSGLSTDAVTYYLDALDSPGDINRLLALRNSAKVLLGSQAPSAGPSTLVGYYLSDYVDSEQNTGNKEYSQSLTDVTFDYMPRFSVADMADGILWRILSELQGPERTWFIGHSVVFDSVKSVIKYNKMLLHLALPDKAAQLKSI